MGNWNSRSKRRKLRKTGKMIRRTVDSPTRRRLMTKRQKDSRKCNERWKKRKMKCNEGQMKYPEHSAKLQIEVAA